MATRVTTENSEKLMISKVLLGESELVKFIYPTIFNWIVMLLVFKVAKVITYNFEGGGIVCYVRH